MLAEQQEAAARELPPIASPVIKIARSSLKPGIEVLLAVLAGGRCEFRGHNQFLYEHPLTCETGNFASGRTS